MMRPKFIFLIVFLFNLKSVAETELFYRSVRGLAMGGAQISAVNDETTVLINPAALGKLRGNTLSFQDIEVELNADTLGLIGSDLMRAYEPQKVLDDLIPNPELIYHAKVQSFIAYARRNFSLGFYGNYRTDAQIDSDPTNLTPFKIDYKNDLAIVLGLNKRFLEGRVKVGVNVRAINRMELKDELPFVNDLTLGSYGVEGIGIASDIGLQLALPWKWLPTLSGVLRDVGGTSYTLEEGISNNRNIGAPEDTPQTLDVGFALFPIKWNYSRFTITGEYRDVLTESELKNKFSRYHLGMEWNSYDKFFIRAGMNQGYWTAGVELAFSKFQLQLASFGQEVGDQLEQKESRNFVVKFTVRF